MFWGIYKYNIFKYLRGDSLKKLFVRVITSKRSKQFRFEATENQGKHRIAGHYTTGCFVAVSNEFEIWKKFTVVVQL